MCSLVFPNNDSVMPGVLKMASGNVTVITRSPRSKKMTSSGKASKREMEAMDMVNDENVDSTKTISTTTTTKSGKKKSKLTGTARRNERERNRVKQVNQGFIKLRDHVPKRGRGRKMSKVDILRSASDYIQNLQGMLDESDAVSAVMNIAALSASLGENGQLLDDASNDSASCSGSAGSSSSQESGFPCSPSPSFDCAPSPGSYSVDGSASSAASSASSASSSSHCDQQIPPYSPEEHTLMDLATWFH